MQKLWTAMLLVVFVVLIFQGIVEHQADARMEAVALNAYGQTGSLWKRIIWRDPATKDTIEAGLACLTELQTQLVNQISEVNTYPDGSSVSTDEGIVSKETWLTGAEQQRQEWQAIIDKLETY